MLGDGSVVKNLPANSGDRGLIPGPGRSHVLRSTSGRAQLLSLCSRTQETELLKPTCARARVPQEKPMYR